MDREKMKTSKNYLDRIVGENIRQERHQRDLSREELAEILDLTASHMGLIERGERGATNVTLMKLSYALDKPIDDFFQENKKMFSMQEDLEEINRLDARRKKIASLITYLSEKELEFVSNMIIGIIRLNPYYSTMELDLETKEGNNDPNTKPDADK